MLVVEHTQFQYQTTCSRVPPVTALVSVGKHAAVLTLNALGAVSKQTDPTAAGILDGSNLALRGHFDDNFQPEFSLRKIGQRSKMQSG